MTWENGLFLPGVSLDAYTIVAAPAAGADYADAALAGGGTRFQLLAMSFTLTTDATVADRRVQLLFRFDHAQAAEQDIVMAQAQVVQPASQTVRYLVGPGYADSTAIVNGSARRALIRLPYPLEMWVPTAGTGWTFDSDVVNLQAADQLSDCFVWYRGALGGGV